MGLEGVGKYPHITVRRTTGTSKLPAHPLKKKKGTETIELLFTAFQRSTVEPHTLLGAQLCPL